METRNEFSVLLEKKYLDWMHAAGERRDQKEFAAWLDVDYVTFNRHLNGTRIPRPDDPIIHHYASKLGPEIYLSLGLLPPELKNALQEGIEEYPNVVNLILDYLAKAGVGKRE
jgi:hypothetical protein